MPRKAFTLVELLVVIGVIALLVSMLLPALAKSRQAAQSVRCLSNQRQVAIAIRMYCDEQVGFNKWISAYTWDSSGNQIVDSQWPLRVIRNGRYLNSMDLARCPSWDVLRYAWETPGDYDIDTAVSYGLRSHYLFPASAASEWRDRNAYRVVGSSSDWPLGADSIRINGNALNDPPYQVLVLSGWGQALHLRHSRAANIFYADGHAAPAIYGELLKFPVIHGNFTLSIIDDFGVYRTANSAVP